MHAYANPQNDKNQGSGYSLIHFDKSKRNITFENWPATAVAKDGDKPYPGWPITIKQQDNDGRKIAGTLGAITVEGVEQPVFQVVSEDTKEILYTIRSLSNTFSPPVYKEGTYTINIGKNLPDLKSLKGQKISGEKTSITL